MTADPDRGLDVCADCGHIRYHHRPACGYVPWRTASARHYIAAAGRACHCTAFTERAA